MKGTTWEVSSGAGYCIFRFLVQRSISGAYSDLVYCRDGLSFAMSGWPCLLQGGFREPGIIRYPPLAKGGQRFSQLASTMDIFVTVLELAGVAPPARPLDGKSLVPVLRDNAASGHTDYFYWRGNAVFAMRHGDFKLHFFTQGCTDYWFPSLEQHEPPLLFNLLLDPAEAYPVRGILWPRSSAAAVFLREKGCLAVCVCVWRNVECVDS